MLGNNIDSRWAVPCAYIVLLCVVFAPFLFGDATFLDSDITTQYYAYFDFYHKALVSGQSFLWNPLLFSGFPAYLSQVGGFFDPLNFVIFNYFDAFDGLHIRLVIDYFLLLLCSYAAGRVWGLSRAAAFCVGLAYMMSFNQVYISNPLFANSAFIMPYLVWIFGSVRANMGFSWKWALYGGAGIGYAFLSGYAQPVVMALTLFGVLGITYAFTISQSGRLQYVLRFLGFSALMSVIGFIIGSPQILPALDFVELTRRSAGVGYSLASLKSVVPGDVLLFLFPDYNYFPYITVGRKALYVGAIWFLLALGLIPLIVRSWRQVIYKNATVFGGVFLISLFIAVKYSPLFYLLQQFPIFSLFRFADRWMYVGSFFLAMFGGFGFDTLARNVNAIDVRRYYVLVSIPIVAFLAGIVFLNILWDRALMALAAVFSQIFSYTLHGYGPFIKEVSHYEDAFIRGITAWQDFTSLATPAFGLPFLALVMSGVLIALQLYKKISVNQFRVSAVFLLVVTFVSSVSMQFEDKLTQSAIRDLQASSFLSFIPIEDRDMYRFYPFMVDAGFREIVPPTYRLTSEENEAQGELAYATGWPNTNFLVDMPTLDGYDVFVTQAYYDVLAMSGSTFGGQDTTRNLSDDQKVERFESNLDVIGMMGGKYIVSGRELRADKLSLLGSYKSTRFNLPFFVYENAYALPRVYIARKVVTAPNQSLTQLIDAGEREFQEKTYLDCSGCSSNSTSGEVKNIRFENGVATIDIETTGTIWVVFSESFLPGWTASINGTETPISRANGLYMAVQVPAGSHTVEFRYHGMPIL